MKYITLGTDSARRPFFYRPDTPDEQVIRQVFENQHYNLGSLARAREIASFLDGMAQIGRRPLIVDAGANIGASSVYFALTFPSARIVAVEPEPGNFAVLSQNVDGLEVRCIQGAISSHAGRTRVIDPGGSHWAYRTGPSGPGPEVPRIPVSQIFQEHGEPYLPFLVKIDIEGGEKELFEANTEWVPRTPLVIIELHDWLLPQQGTALPFLRCVSDLERDFVFIGENVFSIDNRFSLPGEARGGHTTAARERGGMYREGEAVRPGQVPVPSLESIRGGTGG